MVQPALAEFQLSALMTSGLISSQPWRLQTPTYLEAPQVLSLTESYCSPKGVFNKEVHLHSYELPVLFKCYYGNFQIYMKVETTATMNLCVPISQC